MNLFKSWISHPAHIRCVSNSSCYVALWVMCTLDTSPSSWSFNGLMSGDSVKKISLESVDESLHSWNNTLVADFVDQTMQSTLLPLLSDDMPITGLGAISGLLFLGTNGVTVGNFVITDTVDCMRWPLLLDSGGVCHNSLAWAPLQGMSMSDKSSASCTWKNFVTSLKPFSPHLTCMLILAGYALTSVVNCR